MKQLPARGESVILSHPPLVGGKLGWYSRGCRCDDCRAANAAAAMRGRKRKAMGTVSPNQTVPARPAQDALQRMREAGMVWDGMQELIGIDRRELQRITRRGPAGQVTRRIETLILDAAAHLEEQPELARKGQRCAGEGPKLRWMINCLQARGWTGEWIGQQIGWNHGLSTSVISYDRVTLALLRRVEEVFEATHTEWGPSRMVAVRSWRTGKFPSDCYDTTSDHSIRYLPIPGSLHPDLVLEACTYRPRQAHKKPSMMKTLHRTWGQWEKESCAAAALRSWAAEVGDHHDPDSIERICGLRSHHHEVMPAVWQPFIQPLTARTG